MDKPYFGSDRSGILEWANSIIRLSVRLALLGMIAWFSPSLAGEDEQIPVFNIRFEDGRIEPLKLMVPADRRFKIVLTNIGQSPVEFESLELRKEKVVGPGVTTFVVIRRLDAGEYTFFDDFHPLMPQARIIAE